MTGWIEPPLHMIFLRLYDFFLNTESSFSTEVRRAVLGHRSDFWGKTEHHLILLRTSWNLALQNFSCDVII